MAEKYDLRDLDEPVAFKKKNADLNDQGFTRVVIFREIKKGHYDSSARYHAVQVRIFYQLDLIYWS